MWIFLLTGVNFSKCKAGRTKKEPTEEQLDQKIREANKNVCKLGDQAWRQMLSTGSREGGRTGNRQLLREARMSGIKARSDVVRACS